MWRKSEGIDGSLSKSRFGVLLRSVCPRVQLSQPRSAEGGRTRVYSGIRPTANEVARLRDAGLAATEPLL